MTFTVLKNVKAPDFLVFQRLQDKLIYIIKTSFLDHEGQ
jgi:hypothetical protein